MCGLSSDFFHHIFFSDQLAVFRFRLIPLHVNQRFSFLKVQKTLPTHRHSLKLTLVVPPIHCALGYAFNRPLSGTVSGEVFASN